MKTRQIVVGLADVLADVFFCPGTSYQWMLLDQ